jgi:hypothetical protein
MRKALFVLVIVLLSGFVQSALCAAAASGPESVPRMSIEALKAQLGNPDVVVIDVRSTHDWDESGIMIKGAIREDPRQLDSWIKKYPQNKTIVLYCK